MFKANNNVYFSNFREFERVQQIFVHNEIHVKIMGYASPWTVELCATVDLFHFMETSAKDVSRNETYINTYSTCTHALQIFKFLIDYCRQSINGKRFTVQIEKCILTFYTADWELHINFYTAKTSKTFLNFVSVQYIQKLLFKEIR